MCAVVVGKSFKQHCLKNTKTLPGKYYANKKCG
jgi:hypothetical protein